MYVCVCVCGIPEKWRVAIITSIHDKGNKRKCENYRGISVTNTFGRIRI